MTAHDHRTIVPGCYRCELSNDEVADDDQETVIARPNGDLHVTDVLGRKATLHWSRFHGLIVSANGAVYLGQPEVADWLRENLSS